MNQIQKNKTITKWAPVLESVNILSKDKQEWASEYAENEHLLRENAYANASIAGMGAIMNPGNPTQPGLVNGASGSGDIATNLLPVSLKIAGQTIGLDLVSVKPTPGPKIDLLFIDFQYEDTLDSDGLGRPQVFMIKIEDEAKSKESKLEIVKYLKDNNIQETQGGIQGGRVFLDLFTGAPLTGDTPTGNLQGKAEFLGFSRIYGYTMVRVYRQYNAVGASAMNVAPYQFDETKNTFNPKDAILDQIKFVGTVAVDADDIQINLISALEDHLPGFVTNFEGENGKYPMNRNVDDETYPNNIGPRTHTKTVTVGTTTVQSALRRTEIEDIKASAGIDILQKMESVLVNELSQTISKQIVAKITEMGDMNSKSAPIKNGAPIFDFNTDYVGGVGGETTHAVQRRLVTKMYHASNYIATEGRIGSAQFAVTNGTLGASLRDIAGYTLNPMQTTITRADGQLYSVGKIGEIEIYVDPYMRYGVDKIVLGRKNNPDQPGVVFIPYLMAQSFNIISEATMAPKIMLRSRYAVAELGFYPFKQYMTMNVIDNQGLLI